MNKKEILEEIDKIPTFVYRDVAIDYNNVWDKKEALKAITEEGNDEPLAIVSKKYRLVQFKPVFEPIVAPINELEGDLIYYKGFAIMDLFPKDETYNNDGNSIGIVVMNSVDTTASVVIKFCINYDKRKITIPPKISGFKKVHMGNVNILSQDYANMISKVKGSWSTIMERFTNMFVDENNVMDYLDTFKIGENTAKKIKKEVMASDNEINLWDLCLIVFDHYSEKEYKSEVHKRKKLDSFVSKIFEYAMITRL